MDNYCSVVVTTFRTKKNDRAKIAATSIGSLLGTDAGYPWELILVDQTVVNRCLATGRNIGAELSANFRECWGRHRTESVGLGKYLAFADDDIKFRPGWLGACVALLEDPVVLAANTKAIATPIHADIAHHKKCELPPVAGYTRNWRAGSNCFVLSRLAWRDIGVFWDRGGVGFDGALYTRRQIKKRYAVFRTKVPLAFDMALRKHSY